MSEVNVRVKSPISSSVYSLTTDTEGLTSTVKQYLLSLGPLAQPATAFSLAEAEAKGAAAGKEGEAPTVDFKMVLQEQSYSDVALQIEQLSEELGLGLVRSTGLNSGATRLQDIPPGSKKRKGVSDEVILETAEIPALPSTTLVEEAADAAGLVAAKPNPLIPKPAAQDLRFSVWQSLCRDPRIKMQGIIAFVYFVSNDGKEWHFIAYPQGYVYVPQLSNTHFTLPNGANASKKNGKKGFKQQQVSLQFAPTLVQAIEFVSPTTITHARKNADKLSQNILSTNTVQDVTSIAPWLVSDIPAINPSNASQLTPPHEDNMKDYNEDFQTTREITPTSIGERVTRDRSLCQTAADFASAATQGVCKIVEGAIKPLNPDDAEILEDEEDAGKLYLSQGIFYTHGSDFAQPYVGISNSIAARKAAKKDVAGVEQLMKYQNPALCPVLSTVVDYCGERLIAQAPVPGIFRESDEPLIVYGQTEEQSNVQFDEKVDELMKGLAEMLRLKKHPVNKEGVELQTSLEVHGTSSTDGRTYAIDLYRLQIPDLLSESKELSLLRFEAIEEYFTANPEAESLNPDVWMSPENLPSEYANKQFKEDIKNVENVSKFVRDTLLKKFVDAVKSPSGIDPVDGTQLTYNMHRAGLNMRLLGLLYQEATASGLVNLASVALSEAIARSLKVLLREKMTAAAPSGSSNVLSLASGVITEFFTDLRQNKNEETKLQVEKRLKEHFQFTDLPAKWNDRFFPSLTVTRLLSLKLGLQWDEGFNLVAINPVVRYAVPHSLVANEALEAGLTSLDVAIRPLVEKQTKSSESDDKVSDTEESKKEESEKSNPSEKKSDDNGQSEDDLDSEKVSEQVAESLTIIAEAAGIVTQIYGTSDLTVAKVLHRAAVLFYEYGNDIDRAIDFERRAIVVAERVSGVDSSEALTFYRYLAFYEKIAGHTLTAIEVNKRVIELTGQISCDDSYGEASTPYRNVGSILLESKKEKLQQASNAWFQKALDFAEKSSSGASGFLLFELGQSFLIQGDLKKATETVQQACDIFEKTMGTEDPNTVEANKLATLLKTASEAKEKSQQAKNSGVANAGAASANKSVPSSAIKTNKSGGASIDDVLQYIMSGSAPPNVTNGPSKASKKNKKKKDKKKAEQAAAAQSTSQA